MENIEILVNELRAYSNETQWLEFKCNNYVPETIGKDICALANGAVLEDRAKAYFIWGIDDKSHDIVGTHSDLQSLRQGKQELENWLRSMLSDNVDFEYSTTEIQGKTVGVMTIMATIGYPASFQGNEYIRVGSYTKKLKDVHALQMRLWQKLQNSNFEGKISIGDLDCTAVLNMLDYAVYFDLLGMKQPSDYKEIFHYLLEDKIILKQDNGLFGITNLGAVLLAKKLSDFPSVARKAIRIIKYADKNRYEIIKQLNQNKGYAVCFNEMLNLIETMTPTREPIVGGLRQNITAFPMLAIREAVANALIHQDFSVTGAGPTIEIFEGRIEVINPGIPLIDIKRIVDNPPRSRNEALSSLMRRMHICEELGTGWDKMVMSCESKKLPAPQIVLYEGNTKVILYSYVAFNNLTMEDKLWAVYLHSCLQFVQNMHLTNSSLRIRFGIEGSAISSISRLIKKAKDEGLIKLYTEETSNRYKQYDPYWA